MERKFTAEQIRDMREAYLYGGDTLYAVDHDGTAYGFDRFWGTWYRRSGFLDFFESEAVGCSMECVSGEAAATVYAEWCEMLRTANGRLEDAIRFAAAQHAGKRMHGMELPEVLHSLEVVQILSSVHADTELLISGALHALPQEILEGVRGRFGDVAVTLALELSTCAAGREEVDAECVLARISSAHGRLRQLILADRLAEMRSIHRKYRRLDAVERACFDASAEALARYYGGVDDALRELSVTDCADAYWEYVGLYKDVFVKFYVDNDNGVLHQISRSGEHYLLYRSLPEFWETGSACRDVASFADGLLEISRRTAESIEEEWCRNFTICG